MALGRELVRCAVPVDGYTLQKFGVGSLAGVRMSEKFKILVVDDELDVEPLVLQRMRREIRRGTYEFGFAHNGVEALEVLNHDDSYDIVLSDINMPEMDGLTLLEQIPSVNPNIRSVIVSAYGDMKNIRTAMNRGAFDFVTKPIDFEDLRITIDRTVQHLRMWRDALSARDNLISIQNELGIASDMQQSILPKQFPESDSFVMHGVMEPAREVGGDFFDIIHISGDRCGIAIADVSDKGVPAAMFMMSSRTLLKGCALGAMYPEKVLEEVNTLLAPENDAGMFVTVFYGIFDNSTGEIEYSNGGHNPPLIVHADGSSDYLEMPPGIALGVFPEMVFESRKAQLRRGDTAVFYTDGVTEAMNVEGELFGEDRLQKVAADFVGEGKTDFSRAVVEAVRDFAGEAEQSDDITCVSLHWKG